MNTFRLLLMRHAKSDWGDPSLGDHDRPLNRRGLCDAPRIAAWIERTDAVPDVVLCSSSLRTSETGKLLVDTWESDIPIRPTPSLYLASPETILHVIARDHEDARTLLVIGHNPGMGTLVSTLARQRIEMPTAAIAAFEVDLDSWEDLGKSDEEGSPNRFRLIDTARPKAL